MRQSSYSLWVTISVLAILLAIGGLYSFLRQNKRQPSTQVSPLPTLSGLTELSPEPSLSPTSETSSSASPTPTSSPVSNKDQAKTAYQKKDYKTAIAQYKLAIAATTDTKEQANLWNLLANSYRDDKNTDEAIKSYNQAIKLDPKLIEAYINLSNVYISQNKKDLARTTLQIGLNANPGNDDLERELSILNLSGTEGSQ